MWQALLVASLIAVASAGSAQAQTKSELVAKLVSLQQAGIENIGRALAAQTSQRVLQAAGQAIPRLPADRREAAAKEVQTDVNRFYDEVEPVLRKRAIELAPATLAPLYEERFNEDELRQVIAWLESPVSKKLQQIDSDVGNTLAQKVVADTRGTMETRLKALEASLAKRLGVPAAPPPSGPSGPRK